MVDNYPNYYEVLGVSPDADRTKIRRRYLREMHQARKHPDLGGSHHEAALLNEAYMVLRDPQRRAAYDRIYLNTMVQRPQPAPIKKPEKERRRNFRLAYHGQIMLSEQGTTGLSGQCRDLSGDGYAFRTLLPLRRRQSLNVVFFDDPGMTVSGKVCWCRTIPQRFGPPLYEGGVEFSGLQAERFSTFLERIGFEAL